MDAFHDSPYPWKGVLRQNSLYWEVPPERGTFFGLGVREVPILLVKGSILYERVRKSAILSVKRQIHFMTERKRRKVMVL